MPHPSTAQERFLNEKNRRAVAVHDRTRLSWFSFRRRRELDDEIQTRDASIAELAARVADDALRTAFWQARMNVSRRNPAHPEILSALPQHSEDAVAVARESTHYIWPGRRRLQWAEHPDVLERMTPARAETVIRELVDSNVETMADPTFLYWRYRDEHDLPAVIVQHRASGLRARFWEADWGTNLGRIYSKPYSITSIDPDDEHPDVLGDWERYAGLGIGKRLYLVGASLLPDLRWGASSTQSGAIGARIALHAADPYRWSTTGCSWCLQHHEGRNEPYRSWEDRSEADFTAHPRTPFAVPPATLVDVTPPCQEGAP